MTAPRPALLIKPIEWDKSGTARSPVGVYRLYCENVHVWWVLKISLDHNWQPDTKLGPFEREALAKAAAAEDHRDRVLGSIDMSAYERLLDKLLDAQADMTKIQAGLLAIEKRDRRVRRGLKSLRRYADTSRMLLESEILSRVDYLIDEMTQLPA